MKFSCSIVDLLHALQLVSKAIGNQQALPILGNVLLVAEGKYCTVSATDLELSIITHFNASIENEGSITIPAKAFLNFAQYNADSDVLLETLEGTQLRCTSKHAKTLIAGEAASEYPTITSIDRQISLTIEAAPLLEALHLITFSSAHTTLRPVLSGVLFQRLGASLTLVATDSYRLSEYIIQTNNKGEEISCIIPVKILDEVRAILNTNLRHPEDLKKENNEEKIESPASIPPLSEQTSVRTGEQPGRARKTINNIDIKNLEVSIFLSKQQIEVNVGNVRLLSRLIDGKFPDYQQILPKESRTTALFSTHDFSTAAKRLHYFAKEMNNNLTFHITQGQAKLTTPQTQVGRDEAELAAEVTGDENKIALSSSYLLDFLGHIHADNVLMKVTDSLHPAIFSLPDNPRYLHLIMPLRMQEE